MHNIFISYHHRNDQLYKEELLRINKLYDIFNDGSVDTGDISDDLSDQAIREKIRDEYLRDTTVTILLVGTETEKRKHIDWELYSSMLDGTKNKKSGILVIKLPSTNSSTVCAAHGDEEKRLVHSDITSWGHFENRKKCEEKHCFVPPRIIDNLMAQDASISIVPWDKIATDPEKLRTLISLTAKNRVSCDYDLSRPMRRNNS